MNKENTVNKWNIKDNIPYCQFEFENLSSEDKTISLFSATDPNYSVTKYTSKFEIPLEDVWGGYDDWFMPSLLELAAMYSELYKNGIGSFSAAGYGTSSEVNATNYYVGDFSGFPGLITVSTGKGSNARTRPARTFTLNEEKYAIGEIGQAGYVFAKTDNGDGTWTFYEANLTDVFGTLRDFSNVTATAIGTTGTAIGTGQSNTTAIINQSGHTTSASNSCNDLTRQSTIYIKKEGGISESYPINQIYTTTEFETFLNSLGYDDDVFTVQEDTTNNKLLIFASSNSTDIYEGFRVQTPKNDTNNQNVTPVATVGNSAIAISNNTTDYTFFVNSALANMYKIVAIDLQADSIAQLSKTFNWVNINPNGNGFTKSITPRVSPYQYQFKMDGVDAKGLSLNGLSSMDYTIKAGSRIVIGFWYAKQGVMKFFDDSVNDTNNNGAINQRAVEQSKAYQEQMKEEGANRFYVELGEIGLK